ncbi:Response regulator [Gammaproteobacteria bacterium]
MKNRSRVLVVEDEEIVAGLINIILSEDDYQVTTVGDGESAWQTLKSDGSFDAILLDRRLPDIDGMALLQRIKADIELCHIPVVIETGLDDINSVREGLAAGAYYYLTKPLQPLLLLAVIHAAIGQHREFSEIQISVRKVERTLHFLEQGTFRCRTLAESRELAQGLAHACPNPSLAVLGLQELLVNAVEHGNLGITYAEKTKLMIEYRWLDEVERREADPTYRTRQVTVSLTRSPKELRLIIQDEGNGFVWEKYLELSPERAFDPHGRGIAIARMTSFDTIEYSGNGNTVTVTIAIPAIT